MGVQLLGQDSYVSSENCEANLHELHFTDNSFTYVLFNRPIKPQEKRIPITLSLVFKIFAPLTAR